jgi:hypothetical protein
MGEYDTFENAEITMKEFEANSDNFIEWYSNKFE